MANKVDTIRMATLRMAKNVAILKKKRKKKDYENVFLALAMIKINGGSF